jgi:hypothetical protein
VPTKIPSACYNENHCCTLCAAHVHQFPGSYDPTELEKFKKNFCSDSTVPVAPASTLFPKAPSSVDDITTTTAPEYTSPKSGKERGNLFCVLRAAFCCTTAVVYLLCI